MSDSAATLAYGNWTSPLSAHDVAQASVRIGDVTVSQTSVFWGERRPAEGGGAIIASCCDGVGEQGALIVTGFGGGSCWR